MHGPEVLKDFDDVLTRAAEIAHGFVRQLEIVLATTLRPPVAQFVEAIKRLEAGPPVAGYEALLLDIGCSAFEARLMFCAIHHYGEALKQEDEAERLLV